MFQTEPEIIAETDVDRVASHHYYSCSRQIKGQSETSTLSSQPSIDEVRQQMHLLLEEAFSLASAGRTASSRHHQHLPLGSFGLGPVIPYSEVVTSAPGTTCRGRGGLRWVPAYRPDPYQYRLAKQVCLQCSFYTGIIKNTASAVLTAEFNMFFLSIHIPGLKLFQREKVKITYLYCSLEL